MPDAEKANPRSDPIAHSGVRLNLSEPYHEVGGVEIHNAHYYTWDDANGNGVRDEEESIYLVNLWNNTRTYYLVNDGGDGNVDTLTAASRPSHIVDYEEAEPGDDLQNFANWFSYYRRRELAGKAAVGRILTELRSANVGIRSVCNDVAEGVMPVKVPGGGDQTSL